MKACFSVLIAFFFSINLNAQSVRELREGFLTPPDKAKPGVYWYFMDGNMTRASLKKDLESMKEAGLGSFVFLEVNVGIPRGKVDFLSEEWLDLFAYAVKESERLGIEIFLGTGPGWTGSGGPWVKPESSMQVLVGSSTIVNRGLGNVFQLEIPPVKKPYFSMPRELNQTFQDFYEDVAVLAFPALTHRELGDEKALYYRPPYSSVPGTVSTIRHLESMDQPDRFVIDPDSILDLTDKMDRSGRLTWTPPAGNWQVVRFGRRNNGASTRPAPVPGLGFESDKFDSLAFKAHFDEYIGRIIAKTGKPDPSKPGGLKWLHMDSWEMGAQNWTKNFREEFRKRRGYDPLPYYPVYLGMMVNSAETSERFLWDLRKTSQEIIIEHHAGYAKRLAHSLGLGLSMEPYDMNPSADLELGNVADLPMAEFWAKGYGYNTVFSVFEAASLAHINGKSLVAAEAFTAQNNEGWRHYPGAMKNQGDWAFASGVNRLMYHTFQNQFLPDTLRPGATMGPYGIQWNRNQTFWPWVDSYHQYVARCQYLLQQGRAVADILYLIPEGGPNVFVAPRSALKGNDTIPDKREYNFDACAPTQLLTATVRNGAVVFPSGASYQLLVLPDANYMTTGLLRKIMELVELGATVVGSPPVTTPGLERFPESVNELAGMVKILWGEDPIKPSGPEFRRVYGKGQVVGGGRFSEQTDNSYPQYELLAEILKSRKISPDFTTTGPVRYLHKTSHGWDLYFISNTTEDSIRSSMEFRSVTGPPRLWNTVTGSVTAPAYSRISGDQTRISLQLAPYQSYFVVFSNESQAGIARHSEQQLFLKKLDLPWEVTFDKNWGGPGKIVMPVLQDWKDSESEGLKYYSGKAVYKTEFTLDSKPGKGKPLYLNLGEVRNIARVKLNGKDLGVVWTAPWQVNISQDAKRGKNVLEVEIINLWSNRLIGDERLESDGIKEGKWPEWLQNGEKRPGRRFTFATYRHYTEDSPLQSSGLLGPVTLWTEK